MRQARRALVAAFVLAGFANLLQLALPFYALHVFESAIPSASFETLALLTLIAGLAALTLVCLAAARDRIVLRAGLWLDHTLGQHILENGTRLGTPPAEIEKNAAALAVYTGALADRAVIPLFDAPWLPVFLAALVLLHPIMGAMAAACACLLVLATLMQARRVGKMAQQKAQASRRTAGWWAAATLPSGTPTLPADAADQWERINRAHIAAAYVLGKRSAILRDVGRLVRLGGQIAAIAVGAWLVMAHELTPAALFACLLINAALLDPLEHLVASLPSVRAAKSAYRQLGALPADAGSGAPERTAISPPAEPAVAAAALPLNVRGPLAVGLAAILLFAAAGLGATYARLGDLAGLAGGAIFETRLTPLRFSKAGAGARVHVTEGAIVKAGDLIITRDTSDLDRQIVMLKALAEAAKSQLALIGQDTSAMAGPTEPMPTDRPKVAALEQRIGALESETKELLERIARAEQELARSEIRTPVSGRVVALNVHAADAPTAPGTIEIEIATADRPLLARLLDPILRGHHAAASAVQSAADSRGRP